MVTFQQTFFEALRGEDKFHIVSGPLQAGKSTYCRKLAEKYGVNTAYEYMKGRTTGVDVTADEWWRPLMAYGSSKMTNVIETHMSIANVYPWSKNWKAKPIIGGVKQPPAKIQLYFVIPRNYEVYNQRSDELFDRPQLIKAYDYYNDLSKQFPGAKIVR